MFAYLPNTATFVCYMAPFPLDMSHAMPSHCPPSEPTSDDGNSPPRRKVRGKGRGGAGAKYCTMGLGLETVPPNIGDTRWTSWRDGADWYCENWEAWKDFVVLDAGKTKRNEENLSLMHEIHDCITKQGVNCVVRLAFITDHTSVLMAAINLAQSDGPVACFVYDKMKDVQFHWEDTLQRKILHPRIEEALKKLPRSADSIRRKLFGVMEEMLNASKNRFEKEAEQLEFFQQLRVLNPRNLSDMDTSGSRHCILTGG